MKKIIASLAMLVMVGFANAAVTNYFPNGKFDSPVGARGAWVETFAGGTTTYSYPTTGGNPVGYGVMNNASGWGIWVGGDTTPLPLASYGLTAGQTYTFILDMKIISGANIGGIKIESWGPSGQILPDSTELRPVSGSGVWATYGFTYTLNPGSTGIKVVPLWGTSSVVGYDNIGVIVPSTPLAVSITSPLNNSVVISNFSIDATATVSPGTVTNVYFYDGLTLLGNDPTAPYSYAVTGASSGAHTLKAVARDSSGNSATSSVVSITVSNPPPLVGWQLVWNDEFAQADGTSPDSSKWGYDIGGGGWGNAELQYYTSRTNNARIENNQLVIEAKAESFGGSSYTSARMLTKGKWAWTYGRMEARIKIPGTQGIWPAFWMLGYNIDSVGWPTCGEIDIMENIGREPTIIHGTVHGPGYSGGGGIGGPYSLPGNAAFTNDFHLYAIEWTTNQIKWFCDGQQYFTVTTNSIGGNPWVFNHDHFFLLNVAVGGQWPGNPDGTTVFPQKMLVDYVRVYTNAPICVPPAAPTAGNNGPLWMGMTLNLTASTVPGATYSWTGPNGFNSTNQNPFIVNASTNASGQFSVTAAAGGCTSTPAATTVLVNPPAQIAAQTLSGKIILIWPGGILQSATNVSGFWSNVIGATSPRTNSMLSPAQEFYRIKLQ